VPLRVQARPASMVLAMTVPTPLLLSISYDYQPGQQILLLVPDPTKLGSRTTGPVSITQVPANGTVQRTLHISDRINIRRIRPWRQ
jgi:hypothetical protein